jgi:hypothetical protein
MTPRKNKRDTKRVPHSWTNLTKRSEYVCMSPGMSDVYSSHSFWPNFECFFHLPLSLYNYGGECMRFDWVFVWVFWVIFLSDNVWLSLSDYLVWVSVPVCHALCVSVFACFCQWVCLCVSVLGLMLSLSLGSTKLNPESILCLKGFLRHA